MSLVGTITCPECRGQTSATIPMNACLFFFDCPACGAHLRPRPGECCVICSYGDQACPSRTPPPTSPTLTRN